MTRLDRSCDVIIAWARWTGIDVEHVLLVAYALLAIAGAVWLVSQLTP